MAIKGLTDNVRLPRLGTLKIGEQVANASGSGTHPVQYDYFLFPDEHKEALTAHFGEKPSRIGPLYIPVEEEDRYAGTFYKNYQKVRGLVCRGDGETAHRLVGTKGFEQHGDLSIASREDKDKVQWEDVSCPCDLLGDICGPVMNFQFMLPDLPGLGIWQVNTGGRNSIQNILGTLQTIKGYANRVTGIPMWLTVREQAVPAPGGTQRKVSVLALEMDEALTMRQIAGSPEGNVSIALVGDGSGQAINAETAVLPNPDEEPDMSLHVTKEQKESADAHEAGHGATYTAPGGDDGESQADAWAAMGDSPEAAGATQEAESTEEPAAEAEVPDDSPRITAVDVKTLQDMATACKLTAKIVGGFATQKWNVNSPSDLTENQATEVRRWMRDKADLDGNEVPERYAFEAIG